MFNNFLLIFLTKYRENNTLSDESFQYYVNSLSELKKIKHVSLDIL